MKKSIPLTMHFLPIKKRMVTTKTMDIIKFITCALVVLIIAVLFQSCETMRITCKNVCIPYEECKQVCKDWTEQ